MKGEALFVFHCSEGKDRTGFEAYVLGEYGIGREQIREIRIVTYSEWRRSIYRLWNHTITTR